MASPNLVLEFALLDECIERKELSSEVLTAQMKVVPIMVALRDDDRHNFSMLASMYENVFLRHVTSLPQ